MKSLLSSVLVTVVMLSGFCNALAQKKSSCDECSRTRSSIVLECNQSVRNAELKLNCTTGGSLSSKCYTWRGDLKVGENEIPLSRFIADDARRFNPNEYDVLNIYCSFGPSDYSYFQWGR